MTLKQEKFIGYYLGAANGNATEAARLAGYAIPERSGQENLQNPVIASRVREYVATIAASADDVLGLLTDHMHADMADLADCWVYPPAPDPLKPSPPPYFDLKRAKKIGKSKLIKTLKYDKNGNPEVELHDAQAAAVQLGRYHGLFVDKTIHVNQAAEFVQKVARAVIEGAEQFILDEETRDAFIDYIESRMAALDGRGVPESAPTPAAVG